MDHHIVLFRVKQLAGSLSRLVVDSKSDCRCIILNRRRWCLFQRNDAQVPLGHRENLCIPIPARKQKVRSGGSWPHNCLRRPRSDRCISRVAPKIERNVEPPAHPRHLTQKRSQLLETQGASLWIIQWNNFLNNLHLANPPREQGSYRNRQPGSRVLMADISDRRQSQNNIPHALRANEEKGLGRMDRISAELCSSSRPRHKTGRATAAVAGHFIPAAAWRSLCGSRPSA